MSSSFKVNRDLLIKLSSRSNTDWIHTPYFIHPGLLNQIVRLMVLQTSTVRSRKVISMIYYSITGRSMPVLKGIVGRGRGRYCFVTFGRKVKNARDRTQQKQPSATCQQVDGVILFYCRPIKGFGKHLRGWGPLWQHLHASHRRCSALWEPIVTYSCRGNSKLAMLASPLLTFDVIMDLAGIRCRLWTICTIIQRMISNITAYDVFGRNKK